MSALTRTSYYMIATILFGTLAATPALAEQQIPLLNKPTSVESSAAKGAQINGQTFVRRGSGPAAVGGPTPSVGAINGTTVRQKWN